MTAQTMPDRIPACGRVGCNDTDPKHQHELGPGDRIVVEPKLATSPRWAYRCPHGQVVDHPKAGGWWVTIRLDKPVDTDDDGRTHTVDVHVSNIVRIKAWRARQNRRPTTPKPRPRREALDPQLASEPTLFGDDAA